jgi:hypothetical protein
MSGHRQAALALHGLTEQDRQLILEQLPAGDQATLLNYLDELRVLGFDGDSVALGKTAPLRASATPDLESATPDMMFGLLEHEPTVLVAEVLALQEWPWRAGLLVLCGSARRDAILTAPATLAPARARFLRAALEQRLAGMAPAAPAAQSLWTAMLRWGTAWRK